ncbi:hypothetical protein tinsulaeT_04590 [Thalassotalea insulae]|uniref:YbaK/aminoacyl-tRNA synthetase-associated domain-containing protein n=1 Tax=Thalassotalea insulae TaxID=2056778 RepID=A0ABQ6GP76_9GAMM|nr:YbaK/EbsC family protein [Thalassotalea insulae]GLX77119.1 hypothetical protein tinsulaeT_04590 [Thalassotalea insulae]
MTISTRLDDYLHQQNIPFNVVPHPHSNSSIGTAINAQVPLNQIAKAVILLDHEDRKLMAVLPASNRISLSKLNDELMASYHLVKEEYIAEMFDDCDFGAIPPVGQAYNMSVVYDDKLEELDHVYIEAGDHESLIKLSKADFFRMMELARHARFSREVYH